MKLKEALSLGFSCGLDTVEECITNIEHWATSLFIYTELDDEFAELYGELKLYHNGYLKLDIDAIKFESRKAIKDYYNEQKIKQRTEEFTFRS